MCKRAGRVAFQLGICALELALGLLIWLLLHLSSYLKKCISRPPVLTCTTKKTPVGWEKSKRIYINTAEKEFRQSQPNLWKFMTEQPFSLINWQAWALMSIVEIFLCQYSIDLENISLRIFDWSWWKFPFHSRIEFHSSVVRHNRWISGESKN